MTKKRKKPPKAIREKVLDEYNHLCAVCGKERPQFHHIDEDPSNNDIMNLIPLCPNDHLVDVHNPTQPIESEKISLLRKFKDPNLSNTYSRHHPCVWVEKIRDLPIDGAEKMCYNGNTGQGEANMVQPFRFDEEAAIEVILYIANRVETPTFHHISKIIYFADRAHLENYGRFICGDSYVAMRHGPVPSGIYDILKVVRYDYSWSIASQVNEAFSVQEYTVIPHRDANLDYLSDSDVECLDMAIARYGNKPFGALTDLSHDAAWKSADENDFIEIEQIVATFENPEPLLEHLRDPYPG